MPTSTVLNQVECKNRPARANCTVIPMTTTRQEIHEQLIRVVAGECEAWFEANPDRIRGEFVVLVGGVSTERATSSVDADHILRVLARELPPSKAAALTAELTGVPKRELYRQLTNDPEA